MKQNSYIPKIKHLIAIASGKGGVGKSTVAVATAVNLTKLGKKVGILDADLFGPSIPYFFDHHDKPLVNEQNLMLPYVKCSIESASIGYIIDKDKSASWRGPMAGKAVTQLYYQTFWSELDFLIIDMPPGTSDIQLTIGRNLPMSCAILVTTPQILSIADVSKAYDLFKTINIPVIGIVSNMAYLENPVNKEKIFVFGNENMDDFAQKLGTELIATLPIRSELSENTNIANFVRLDYAADVAQFIAHRFGG